MSNVNFKQNQQAISPDVNYPDQFDFDLWASHVKRQMLACLRKRGTV